MLRVPLSRYRFSQFQMSPVVKAYIIAEAFVWSAWNFTSPIFSVFVVNTIPNGNIQLAATGYSIHVIVRVIFELISGKYLAKSNDMKKMYVTVIGMFLISLAYFGLSYSSSIIEIYLLYGLIGMGIGTATPAKNALFSKHLDKNKESTEWSITDATQFICIAIAISIGGFVAAHFGFSILFLISALINTLGILPYLFYVKEA